MKTTDSGGSPILEVGRLGFPWPTVDPFLFCAYHDDDYPAGNDQLGPAASLAGRALGQDFTRKDGWRMYHGQVVPGFPQHPHRGFETVTIVRRGFVDHSDSLGACARFGEGDVQWMTAGSGIVHAEMFPLLDPDEPNPLEMFQIWLNLPRAAKMSDPHFAMLWADQIPRVDVPDGAGAITEVRLIAGQLGDARGPAPSPASWAAQKDNHVQIWTIDIPAGGSFELPPTAASSSRTLYFYRGRALACAGERVELLSGVGLRPEVPVTLEAGDASASLLLLSGRPIAEPVAHYGPFVMSSTGEVRKAFSDYQQTQFGGWPWPSDAPVHARDAGRFARHADGRVEQPGDGS